MKAFNFVIISFFCLLMSLSAQAEKFDELLIKFENNNRYFGTATSWKKIRSDSLYRKKVSKFRMITPEFEMKFNMLQQKRGRYTFDRMDSLLAFCQKNQIVVRGHTLIWADCGLPDWMLKTCYSKVKLQEIMEEYISTVASHFKGKLYCWDVVNEAIDNNGKFVQNIYYTTIGDSYIDSAFVWAHRADPTVKLFYNDYYTNYGWDQYKKKLLLTFELISRLKQNKIQVDGVGLQMHMEPSRPVDYSYFKKYLAMFSALGLEIHFTEIDVAIDTPFTPKRLCQQGSIYKEVCSLFMAEPACKAFVVWGFTDAWSWIPEYSKGAKGAACLLDSQYNPKPAVDSLLKIFQ